MGQWHKNLNGAFQRRYTSCRFASGRTHVGFFEEMFMSTKQRRTNANGESKLSKKGGWATLSWDDLTEWAGCVRFPAADPT